MCGTPHPGGRARRVAPRTEVSSLARTEGTGIPAIAGPPPIVLIFRDKVEILEPDALHIGEIGTLLGTSLA